MRFWECKSGIAEYLSLSDFVGCIIIYLLEGRLSIKKLIIYKN